MPPVAALLPAILINLAIAAVFTIVSRLLAPHNQAPTIGGELPAAKDPGTQLTLRTAAQPHNIVFGRRRVAGNIVFAHCTGNNAVLHLIVTWAGHQVEALQDLYFNDEIVPLDGSGNATGKYAGCVVCKDHLGADDQAADADLIAACPDKWTVDHRARGIAYSYIRLTFNRSLFPQGLPNIWRVVKGFNQVYDPRDASTGWSDNAILCAAAFMASAKYGRAIPYGGLNGIDATALSAAANICDETVALADGGSEKRYSCNALLTSDTAFADNLDKLLSACAGTATPIGGAWMLKVAAWEAPTIVFDENDFRAAFQVQNGLGNADAFNAIKGKYANPDKLWQPDDFPAITSSVYEIEDGGDGTGTGREFKDVSLDCTTSASMAQRLARIDLRRARQPLTFTAQLKLRGLLVQPGDTVAVSFAFLGWVEKAFRVESTKLVVGFAPGASATSSQPGIIGVDLDLRETASAIYDWDAALDEQAVDPAPNTTLPDPFNALPPSNLTASESLYSTRDGGGVKAKVTLAWQASPDAFVTSGGWYGAEYKASADSAWTKLPTTQATTIDVLDIEPGTYDFRVFAYQWTGARSSSAPTITGRQIAGLSAAPSAPAGFTVAAMESFALARATIPAELDVLQGGYAVFKHSPAASGATWATALTLCDPLPAAAGAWALPLKAGTYLLEFYDSSGVPSGSPASFVVRQASAHNFTSLAGGLVTEDPGFAGAKANCGLVGGNLVLTGSGLISAIPAISGVRSIAYYGGVESSGTYDFASKMDLGSVKRHRLTDTVTAQILSALDRISLRTNNVSTWPRVGSSVSGDEADSYLLVASTDDDPASGGATWTAYQRLDAATFNCRGHKFRRVLESSDPSFTPAISADSVVAEGV